MLERWRQERFRRRYDVYIVNLYLKGNSKVKEKKKKWILYPGLFEALRSREMLKIQHPGALTTLRHLSSFGVTLGTMQWEDLQAIINLVGGAVLQPASEGACMACASARRREANHCSLPTRFSPNTAPVTLSNSQQQGPCSPQQCFWASDRHTSVVSMGAGLGS